MPVAATGGYSDDKSTAQALTDAVQCKTGFNDTLGKGTCVDVNECLNVTACKEGSCENTLGSFECHCKEGFVLDGDACIDYDECSEEDTCEENYSCKNTEG